MIAYIDGGSRGNPGNSGIGVVLTDETTCLRVEISKFVGVMTNNQAEYLALILALSFAQSLSDEITVYSDSELVVKQMTFVYACTNKNITEYYYKAQELAGKFKVFGIKHIPREQNQVADRLANEAMDRFKRQNTP